MKRTLWWAIGGALLAGHLVLGWQAFNTMQAVERAARALERSVTAATRAFISEDK